MAERKSRMDATLVQKGAAKPEAVADTPAWKQTTAVTVRLDDDRYRQLVAISGLHIPRKTHQQILLDALDRYFKEEGV